MPKRAPTASSTRMPSGTTSLPMPSPGMTAILSLLVGFSCLAPAIASYSQVSAVFAEVPRACKVAAYFHVLQEAPDAVVVQEIRREDGRYRQRCHLPGE